MVSDVSPALVVRVREELLCDDALSMPEFVIMSGLSVIVRVVVVVVASIVAVTVVLLSKWVFRSR